MRLLQPAVTNRILARLPEDDFAALAPLLEPISCPLGIVLVEQDVEITHTYFLDNGVTSLVPISTEGHQTEGGLIGRDGYTTPATVLGSKTIPYRCQMQIPGAGYRIACGDLLATINARASLRDRLQRFAQALTVQMTYTVLANAVFGVEERLARWLLMCHDRSDSDDLALTHSFMALMLSVRRPTVTTALHALEGHRFVRADRGYVTIRNRAALETFAGDAYGKPEAEYRKLLGPM